MDFGEWWSLGMAGNGSQKNAVEYGQKIKA